MRASTDSTEFSAASDRSVRLTLLLAGAVVLADLTLFTALGPILPDLSTRYGLSAAAAGVLSACAPLGEFVTAIPTAVFCVRFGPRRAIALGVTCTTIASVVFGFNHGGFAVLLAARFFQGFGSALSWIGCLTLASELMPPERRGEAIGLLMSAAALGTLTGPLLGAAASAWGLGPAFISYGVVLACLGAFVATRPAAPHVVHEAQLRGLFGALRTRQLRHDIACVLALAAVGAGILLLTPLVLDHYGASTAVITAVFVASAVASTVLNPMMGRWADRIGTSRAIVVGFALAGVPVVLLAGPVHAVAFLAVALAFAALGGNVGMVPAGSAMSTTADTVGIPTAFGFSLMSLAWAPGFSGGSLITGALADIGYGWAFGALAVASFVMAATVARR
jgi:MFS family permease